MKLSSDDYEIGFVWMSSTEPEKMLSPIFTTKDEAMDWQDKIEKIVIKQISERLNQK